MTIRRARHHTTELYQALTSCLLPEWYENECVLYRQCELKKWSIISVQKQQTLSKSLCSTLSGPPSCGRFHLASCIAQPSLLGELFYGGFQPFEWIVRVPFLYLVFWIDVKSLIIRLVQVEVVTKPRGKVGIGQVRPTEADGLR